VVEPVSSAALWSESGAAGVGLEVPDPPAAVPAPAPGPARRAHAEELARAAELAAELRANRAPREDLVSELGDPSAEAIVTGEERPDEAPAPAEPGGPQTWYAAAGKGARRPWWRRLLGKR
jgi:hypothetical protein